MILASSLQEAGYGRRHAGWQRHVRDYPTPCNMLVIFLQSCAVSHAPLILTIEHSSKFTSTLH